MLNKKFTAVSTFIENDKIIYIVSSKGQSAFNHNGLQATEILDFIFNLKSKSAKDKTAFVCYNFVKSNEFIFSRLAHDQKAELFQNHIVLREIDELEKEKKKLEKTAYCREGLISETERMSAKNQIKEISAALALTGKIKFNGYSVRLQQGRSLSISKKKTTIVLYDIYGFFRKSLKRTFADYFPNFPADFFSDTTFEQFDFINLFLAKLADNLYRKLSENGINLSRFYGASAVTSAVLSKSKARTEYKNYKSELSLPSELRRASLQAFYGGRIEQYKLGYFKDVNVYDLNSAYAKACLYLPKMLHRPIALKSYRNEPFSVWKIEYDLPEDLFFGLLPHRRVNEITTYGKQGKGYFWKPEVDFLTKYYPDRIKIYNGFYVPFERTNFSRGILELYNLRLKLKNENHPLEKVIKLALAIIYGKFCQRIGAAYYYNMFYAGYVTSYVRAQLLFATYGFEKETICILTDAIHTTANLNVPLSDEIGEYKHNFYDETVYLGSGIYQLRNNQNQTVKEATRGFSKLDFENAFNELKAEGFYNVFQDFFVGYNLYSFAPTKFNNYLGVHNMTYKVNPLNSKLRLYEALKIDFQKSNVVSKMRAFGNRRESAVYNPINSVELDFINVGINANDV